MAWVAVAVAGSALVGGLMSSSAQKSAADTAANAQIQSTQAGIAEQQRQFDAIQKLLAPYVSAGNGALTQEQNLIGVNGNDAQQAMINQIQGSPAFTSAMKIGENRILANASATGGLRGGNTQAALGYFGPQLLTQLMNDRYSQLGGLISVGQNAAAGVGNAGMQTGQGISGLLQQAGSAQAGAALAGGRAAQGMYDSFGNSLGMYYGLGGRFNFGSTSPATSSADAGPGLTPPSGAGDMLGQDFSDVRLKTDVRFLGVASNGLPTYRFRYVWGGPEQVGHMAHEVRERYPHAVHEHESGFLMVDYGALHD
jgi:hypothetical protein